MRGKVSRKKATAGYSRITPAYAGKSSSGVSASLRKWDHPCVCGEKYNSRSISINAVGSPLRMRGKEGLSKHDAMQIRITPAYAGKRTCHCVYSLLSWDHPCVCGEKKTQRARFAERLGSPLRMRGKEKLQET